MSHTLLRTSGASFFSLRTAALHALALPDPKTKSQFVLAVYQGNDFSNITTGSMDSLIPLEQPFPGRPAKPKLRSPKDLPKRSMTTLEGRAALLHALTHIEFNAINLALDAVWRFPAMPRDYYHNWWQVAYEEVLHFNLMREHLETLGYQYGDFDAHDGLWEMVEKTHEDVCARMALIPRTLEARGLDVTPGIQQKLRQAGDLDAAAILDIILRDEIGHVAFGNHWYAWLCNQRGLDPDTHYLALCEKYHAPRIHLPLNTAARKCAGFSEMELATLMNGAK